MSNEFENSPQYNKLTTSNSGTNVRSALQPTSFFFTDGSYNQTADQKFGVVSSSQYRGTTKLNCTGKIFTLCQGQIFIQPQTGNNDKVNVVLKPFKQPINQIPIKYIIYRGLDRNNFFTGENIAGSEDSGTEFCQYIWKEFNKFYGVEDPEEQPEFLAKFIGFPFSGDNSQQLTDRIDSYFYKIVRYLDEEAQEETPGTAYEFPLVPAGTELGTASGEIGIDIILNDGDFYNPDDSNPFRFDLAFARATETLLNTSTGTTYEKKLIRQAATQFLDLAAFYGLHANGSGILYIPGTSPAILTTPEEILLKLNSFLTKNTTYIYIQGDRQRYYNFYDNYNYSPTDPNDIRIGNSVQDIQSKAFAIDGWPVHAIIPTSGSVVLQLITDNYSGAGLYVKTGNLSDDTPQEGGFIRDENLSQIPTGEENDTTDINYTQPITLVFPKVGNNAVSSIVELIYEGKQLFVEENGFPENKFPLKDIDDVFGLLNAESFVQKTRELELPSVMDSRLQLINFPNSQRGNDIGTVQTKRIEDIVQTTGEAYLQRVTYETLLIDMKRNAAAYLKPSSTLQGGKGAGSTHYKVERNNFYQPEIPYYLKTQIFTDSAETITGLILNTTDGSIPTKKLLGITKEENQRLLDLIEDNELANAKVYLRSIYDEYETAPVSPEGFSFRAYSLNVVAENQDGVNKIYVPMEDIYVYVLDGYAYVSNDYARYLPELNLDKLVIISEIVKNHE